MRACSPLVVAGALVGTMCFAAPAVAQRETVIASFGHGNGRYPAARLYEDRNGNFFGTAELGGKASDKLGTVFEVSGGKHAWATKAIYNFSLLTGGFPEGGVIRDMSGALYGTAGLGDEDGCGNVFELKPHRGTWAEMTLHNFSYSDDGCVPVGELVHDSAGDLYGVTGIGGTNGEGTVFELLNAGGSWSYAILYSFAAGTDGNRPQGIRMDSSGTIYGTTASGGVNGEGTVFELTQKGGAWRESILHSFGGAGDGSNPTGGLGEDSAGNLYGAARAGGAYGAGTVYELSRSGKNWIEATLYSFTGGSDGNQPYDGVTLAKGALYGVTPSGGSAGGGGVVYRLTQSGGTWTETVLHSFPLPGGKDGSEPSARPIVDKSGVVYGVTLDGAENNFGRVYRIVP